jgi:hypothetical protein
LVCFEGCCLGWVGVEVFVSYTPCVLEAPYAVFIKFALIKKNSLPLARCVSCIHHVYFDCVFALFKKFTITSCVLCPSLSCICGQTVGWLHKAILYSTP